MSEINELLNDIKTKKHLFGHKETLKNIDKVERIYIASNCPEEIMKKIKERAKKAEVKVKLLNLKTYELKELCKKPFPISVISVLK